MIVITGAAGFIASCLVGKLNQEGREDLILVDKFDISIKERNFKEKKYAQLVDRDFFEEWLKNNQEPLEVIYHLGARTDTTEFNRSIFDRLNLNYSKMIWNYCTEKKVPLVYASSAATYGLGEHSFQDLHEIVPFLEPLNPYGESKNDFDKWVLEQKQTPPHWYAMKFFNVYGPNEYHKGRMASVVFHTFNQVRQTGQMKLFKSHNPHFKDGEQLRDFIYVKDVVEICQFLATKQPASGIYNVGTGKARTFKDLAKSTFLSMDMVPKISYIDTPFDIRAKYQYFTEATTDKLRAAGYEDAFYSLEDGVNDYVNNYLILGLSI